MDLPGLLREYMHPEEFNVLPSDVKFGIGTGSIAGSMRALLKLVYPSGNLVVLYHNERQILGGRPEGYKAGIRLCL